MQIVIEIPEGILNTIQADEMINREQLAVLQMHILNGTPLPKGHGRLIDESTITEVYTRKTGWKDVNGIKVYPRIEIIGTNAPTIIEADKESEEE